MMGEAQAPLLCGSPASDREFKLPSHVTPWSEGGGPSPSLWKSQSDGRGTVCFLGAPSLMAVA